MQVQPGGRQSRQGASQGRRQCRQPGVDAVDDQGRRDRRAERETTVHRQIRELQYPERQIDAQSHQSEHQTDFDGSKQSDGAHRSGLG
jgi:hypothetical protein